VARFAQRVAVLAHGRLVALGAPGEVLADPERLAAFGLEPLPVTTLAAALNWPPPLPLTVDEALTRVSDG
jgi:ABC-type hemin transport system ATPase subunit